LLLAIILQNPQLDYTQTVWPVIFCYYHNTLCPGAPDLWKGKDSVRILIIGGTRFIGPPLVRRLHDQGHTLWLFHRTPSEIDLPFTVQHILGDRYRMADHAGALHAIRPETVIDMIPLTQADAQATMNLFRGYAERVVALSSQDVYRAYGRVSGIEPGPPDPVPLTEDSLLRQRLYAYRNETPRASDDPWRWLDDYEKILVERAVMNDPDLPGTVLRLPMIYGPGDYQHRLWPYLKRMDDGRLAILMNEQFARWRWTRDYVENTAAAIALAATDTRAAGRVYNLGELPTLSIKDWIREIARVVGWEGRIVTVPDYQLPEELKSRAGMEQHLDVDSSRIRYELGYEPPISRDEALRRAIAWERANPPSQVNPAEFDYATEDAILSKLD
jgi:nucleoside-diphosphate-sugar epimerase